MLTYLTTHAWVGWAVAVGGWLFSGAMSTMPPLRKDSGYFVTWSHDFLQWAAANWPKRQQQPQAIAVVVPGKE